MPDKGPPNKTNTASGVGSNMPTDDSTCKALRSISKENYPTTVTETQKALRGLSDAKPKQSSGNSGAL